MNRSFLRAVFLSHYGIVRARLIWCKTRADS